ncbi:hypothetical protein TRE132_53740 [Pseudomonas chlororaphis subsp. aurantiaca]|nr:hypothetical protein TRE132_53740 [Pseudomonas chlororaphis subsp. aurantiaca]
MLDSLLVPTAIVALAEIGDKTQLLALILAARFRKPWPIIAGIVAATLANHAAAGAVGAWFGSFFSDATLHWILAASFTATALWTLVPDKMDDDEASTARKFGPFLTTLIAFFLAEIGDKTQIATVMLAAQYPELWLVIIGTTAGMLIANVPVVLAGNFAAEKTAPDPDPSPRGLGVLHPGHCRGVQGHAEQRLVVSAPSAGTPPGKPASTKKPRTSRGFFCRGRLVHDTVVNNDA